MNKLRLLALGLLLCAGGVAFGQGLPGYIYPIMPQIHQAGAGGTAGPTAVPSISVPTAIATDGNVLTLAGGASATTHDMQVCCVENQTSVNALTLNSTVPWARLGPVNAWNGSSSVWFDTIGHCVQANETGGSTQYTFAGLGNTQGTRFACNLLRNTHCGQDTTPTVANTGASTGTAAAYPNITTNAANAMLEYCQVWGASASTTMSANPSGLTADASVPAISGSFVGLQIGHKLSTTAGTYTLGNGTLSHAETSGGNAAAIDP